MHRMKMKGLRVPVHGLWSIDALDTQLCYVLSGNSAEARVHQLVLDTQHHFSLPSLQINACHVAICKLCWCNLLKVNQTGLHIKQDGLMVIHRRGLTGKGRPAGEPVYSLVPSLPSNLR